MSFKQNIMSGAKLGGAAFVGYALNRFLSTMEYSKQIMKESPETGAVIVSAGITVGAIKLQDKIKDKLVRVGIVAGSASATLHLATRIPTVQNALPAGVVSALAGETDEYIEVSGEEAENQINAEVDRRIQQAFSEGKIQYLAPSESSQVGESEPVYEFGNDEFEEEEEVSGAESVFDLV
ncbi:hypothetical protein CH354_05910 [Leptospira levettii]|uniref:Uncharacterized protein n=1 Tax=Leptospira limi TaxID=2950023 RepID=A0ABT3LYJ9_9LEPT|nr:MULTISPECIES: hypothetical protein [Leptospira]MCW7462809.1 hypothetical protein [Leptospira limi]PJZ38726.1 hypothetical protein CH354_05910 [Leptospira levettii]